MVNFNNPVNHKKKLNNPAILHSQMYDSDIIKREFPSSLNHIPFNPNTTPNIVSNPTDNHHMDIIPSLSLHNNRQESLDLSTVPLDPSYYNSKSFNNNNTNPNTLLLNRDNSILGASDMFRQTSLDYSAVAYPNTFSWLEQHPPTILPNQRQNSFEFVPKFEDTNNNNNNNNNNTIASLNGFPMYLSIPSLSNVGPISYSQSIDSNTTIDSISDGDMPSLSPMPLELPSPSHLPVGRLSRFLSEGAQVHQLERQADEIKHNQQEFFKHHPEIDPMQFDTNNQPLYSTTAQPFTSSFGRAIRKRKANDDEYNYESDGESIDQSTITNSSFQSDSDNDSEWTTHHHVASPALTAATSLFPQPYSQYQPTQYNLFNQPSIESDVSSLASTQSQQSKPKKQRKHKGEKRIGITLPKDRHVKSAQKFKTGGELQESVLVDIIPIYYNPPNDKAHKIRLIQVKNSNEQTIRVFAHGADVGGVVERKSNISRLFGKFESPSEKLLMNVIGSHNTKTGQEANVLPVDGLKRFLTVNKMKGQEHYAQWLKNTLIPLMNQINAGDHHALFDLNHEAIENDHSRE